MDPWVDIFCRRVAEEKTELVKKKIGKK